jgi:hypothetical protein
MSASSNSKTSEKRFYVTLVYEDRPSERHTKLDPEEVMVEVYRALEKLLLGEPGLVSMIIGVERREGA